MFGFGQQSAEKSARKALGLSDGARVPTAAPGVEDFVSEHTGALDYYEEQWRLTAITDITHSDLFVETVHSGIMKAFSTQGHHYDEQRVRSTTTTKMIEDFTLWWGLGARKIASNISNPLKYVSAANEISSKYSSQDVADIVNNFLQGANVRQIRDAIVKTAVNIRVADDTADSVTSDIAHTYLSSADNAESLWSVFEDPLSRQDEYLKRLRRIMNVDWYRMGSAKGVLGSFIKRLGEADGASYMLPNFAMEIAGLSADSSDKRRQIHDLAVFSLANVGLEPTEDRIVQLLIQKQANWQMLPTAKVQFDSYHAGQLSRIESYVQDMVGRKVPNEFRYHISLDAPVMMPLLYPPVSRHERTGKQRARAQTQNINLAAMVEAMVAGEVDQGPKARIVHYVSGNNIIACKTIEDAVDRFCPQDNKNPTLRADVKKMLEFLSTTNSFVNSGLVRLQKEPLVINGRKKIGLWRFAPAKCAGMNVSNANRHYRVVCGFDGDNLIIQDILSHEDFDKKY